MTKKSCRGYDYNLIDALRRNPTIIMAGDDICAIAADEIESLQSARLELLDALKEATSAYKNLVQSELGGASMFLFAMAEADQWQDIIAKSEVRI